MPKIRDPSLVSRHSVRVSELTFTLDTFSVLGSPYLPCIPARPPPSPNSPTRRSWIPSKFFRIFSKIGFWEGQRPQIGEKSPFRLVGRPPLPVSWLFSPSQGQLLDGLPAVLRVGWWGGGQEGRRAQGRLVGSPRHPRRIRYGSWGKAGSWVHLWWEMVRNFFWDGRLLRAKSGFGWIGLANEPSLLFGSPCTA